MNVLVVGDDEQTESTVAALRATGAGADSADPAAALDTLAAAPDEFALVLVERQGGPGCERQLHDALAATGMSAPIRFLGSTPASAEAGPPPMCAIEQTAGGTRLLRCALAAARRQPDNQDNVLAQPPHVFAYCAPVRRGG
jgi:hypothetical protein